MAGMAQRIGALTGPGGSDAMVGLDPKSRLKQEYPWTWWVSYYGVDIVLFWGMLPVEGWLWVDGVVDLLSGFAIVLPIVQIFGSSLLLGATYGLQRHIQKTRTGVVEDDG